MTLVDSTVWIDFLRGRRTPQVEWLLANLGTTRIAIAELCLAEVLQGARRDSEFEQHQEDLLRYPVIQCSGKDLMVDAASRYSWLRSHGITIRSTIDSIVATMCIREGFTLLHNDRDYDAFERYFELKVVEV